MVTKICTKEKCGYVKKPCVATISGWDSALCHCLIDGRVVVWVPLNKGNRPDAEDIAYQAKCDAREELIDRAFED